MSNIKRHPDFFYLKKWIEKPLSYDEMKSIEPFVNLVAVTLPESDRNRILTIYENRCAQLSLEPEYIKNSIESKQHKKLSK